MWRGSIAILVALGSLGACATVQPYEREYLSDPTMQLVEDPLEAAGTRKLYTAREGASGGDGQAAGGGCACSN